MNIMEFDKLIEQVNKLRLKNFLPQYTHQDVIFQGILLLLQSDNEILLKQIYDKINSDLSLMLNSYFISLSLPIPYCKNQTVLIYEQKLLPPYYKVCNSVDDVVLNKDAIIKQYVNLQLPFKFFLFLNKSENVENYLKLLKLESYSKVSVSSANKVLYIINYKCNNYDHYCKKTKRYFQVNYPLQIKLPMPTVCDACNIASYLVSFT